MKILYDHQIFTLQNYGGISRYFAALMEHYHRKRKPDFDLSLRYSNSSYLKNSITPYKTFFKNFNSPSKTKIMFLLNKMVSYKSLRMNNYDIFHPTYYDPYFIDHIKSKPFILTIYDMIHEIYKQQLPASNKASYYKKLLAHKADKILTISKNTKKDILRFYPEIDEEKVVVTYLASSLSESDSDSSIIVPERYLLFVGNRRLYKNFEFFIRSVKNIMAKDDRLRVVCAGGGRFTGHEKVLLEDLKIEDRVDHYEINDRILAQLYKNAIAFIFPSLYEGFGIPVLEGFECKCPAVLSNSSSLSEIAGEAAVYFDPEDRDSIEEAVKRVVYDADLRKKMIEKGSERVKDFSWRKTAEQTEMEYMSVL